MPPLLLKASRRMRRCSPSALANSSAPSWCKSVVEPSTSVNRKVTVPEGRSRTASSCAREEVHATDCVEVGLPPLRGLAIRFRSCDGLRQSFTGDVLTRRDDAIALSDGSVILGEGSVFLRAGFHPSLCQFTRCVDRYCAVTIRIVNRSMTRL